MFKKKIAAMRGFFSSELSGGTLPVEGLVDSHKECTRDIATRKRVRDAIEAQHESLMAKALKPHACNDPINCTKALCFRFQPDVIVGRVELGPDSPEFKAQLLRYKKNQKKDGLQ